MGGVKLFYSVKVNDFYRDMVYHNLLFYVCVYVCVCVRLNFARARTFVFTIIHTASGNVMYVRIISHS